MTAPAGSAHPDRRSRPAAAGTGDTRKGTRADWRRIVRRQPLLAIGVAAAGGVVLGAVSHARLRPARRPHAAAAVLRAGERVAGSALSALLMRRATSMLLDFVFDRARSAWQGRRPPRDTTVARSRVRHDAVGAAARPVG